MDGPTSHTPSRCCVLAQLAQHNTFYANVLRSSTAHVTVYAKVLRSSTVSPNRTRSELRLFSFPIFYTGIAFLDNEEMVMTCHINKHLGILLLR